MDDAPIQLALPIWSLSRGRRISRGVWRPNAVDMLGGFQVVKETVVRDRRDGDDMLEPVGGINEFTGAKVALVSFGGAMRVGN